MKKPLALSAEIEPARRPQSYGLVAHVGEAGVAGGRAAFRGGAQERAAAQEALTEGIARVAADQFRIVIEPDAPSWVVVVGVGGSGKAWLALPEAAQTGPAGPLAPGRIHRLPEPSVTLRSPSASGPVTEYSSGFALPWEEAEATVLVAVREDAPDAGWKDRLSARLAPNEQATHGAVARWSAWLADEGWKVHALRVHERP